MKQLPLLIGLVASILVAIPDSHGQAWGDSQNCHINARTSDDRFGGRSDLIDATFNWVVVRSDGSTASCTGVLMNRRVDQDELGFYFSTARHCLHYGDVDLGAPDIDLNVNHFFMFHYESPSGESAATEPSNQGQHFGQSVGIDPVISTLKGYEYFHRSRVELVKESIMADYALLRMVTPPPPHFNLYFAGWQPSSSGVPPNGMVLNPCGQWHGYVLPNHPSGDIKKINGAAAIQNPTMPFYFVCNIVTTVIDFLFGWLSGNSSSTQSICAYADIPWYTVQWCDHGVEGGSSGSPLFDPTGKYIGPLSGLGNPCSGWVPTGVGKFKNVYPFAAIKNTLNPSHHLLTDLSGIDGRRIRCYTDLVLPGGGLDEAYYFPANHYQSENRITLRAQQHINVTAPITILEGAHYEFLAGGSVVLNGMVEIRPGATFVAAIEGCTKSMDSSPSNFSPTFVRLPEKLALGDLGDKQTEAQLTEVFLTVFPNPAHSTVQFRTDLLGPWHTEVYAPLGNVVRSQLLHSGTMSVSGLAPGIYYLRISNSEGDQRTASLVITDRQ